MFGLSRNERLPGWVACAPAGAASAFALVQPGGADGRPAVRWTATEPWAQPVAALQRLRRRHALHRHACVAVLQRHQYKCVTMDAPPGVPRDDWAAAVRWQLQDTVDFPVDSAAVGVLAVPEGTSYRTQHQLIAVAAPEAQVRPLVEQAVDAGAGCAAAEAAATVAAGAGDGGAAGAATVGCGDAGVSLTGLAPCGLDSIRGNSEAPFWIVLPASGASQRPASAASGRDRSIGNPSCSIMCAAAFGMNG